MVIDTVAIGRWYGSLMPGRTRRPVEQADVRDSRDSSSRPAVNPARSGAPPGRADMAYLQRTMGNTAVARALQGSDTVVRDATYSPDIGEGKRPRTPRLTQVTQASVQRNEESEEVLTTLATPQVRPGPAIEVQKELVEGIETNLAAIILSDAEAKRAYDTEMERYLEAHKRWEQGWGWFRGSEPKLPDAPFGGRLPNSQVTAETASEFNLGGILIDSLPEYKRKDVEGFYEGLAERARLIPLDPRRVAGARSSGTVLPELVAGLAPLVIENTLRTMIDASQFKYLRAAGLPNAQWKILVEVHYIRARPKDMAGFHKDTQGQTLFVNLNYHAGEHSLRGPEYVLNPPRSGKHDERIYGTGGKAATLPKEFTDDLTYAREQLGDPTEIRSSGTVTPYGYVAFVDEAIHHATPFFENRYVTPAEFRAYLTRADKNKLDAIIEAEGKADDVDASIISADEVEKWTAWWRMITNAAKDARYTRLDFAATMEGDEFDRMLENVGAQEGAERQRGGAGGWYAASIPNDGRAPLHTSDKPPLVRQASNPDLSKTWPKQLPDEVPRRFLRTWVRAVPESMAAQLRNLR